jgi:hypothetical protein
MYDELERFKGEIGLREYAGSLGLTGRVGHDRYLNGVTSHMQSLVWSPMMLRTDRQTDMTCQLRSCNRFGGNCAYYQALRASAQRENG